VKRFERKIAVAVDRERRKKEVFLKPLSTHVREIVSHSSTFAVHNGVLVG
jgi:hypothetical protein